MPETPPKRRRSFWRIARRVFRWCRIFAWLIILALLIFAIWLHRVGLPSWAKDRLVTELRDRGVEVEFARMRLVWHRGIVADDIRFGRSGQPRGLNASARQAEVHLRMKPLLRGQIDVEGVSLSQGHLMVPVWGTNDRPQELNVEKVNGELRFLPNDQWDLSGLRAEAFGVKMMLNGTITNASYIRGWKFGREKPKAKTPQAFWHNVIADFERTKFEAPTEILGRISGDARDLGSFRANVNIRSPAIDSPWGKGRDFRLSAQIEPQPGVLIHANVRLEAQEADTRWGRAASVYLEGQLTPSLTQWTPTNAHLDLQLKRAQTPWANASALTIKADFRPNPADPASSLVEYSARGQQIQTKWARFAQAEITSSGVVSSSNAWPNTATTKLRFAGGNIPLGRASAGSIEATLTLPPYQMLQFTNDAVSWWSRLDLVAAEVNAQLADVHSDRFDAKSMTLKSSWKPPLLRVQELDVAVFGGNLRGSANLDTSTRDLTAEMKSTVDPHLATNLLTTNTLRYLSQFQWEHPPSASMNVRMVLPTWTNQAGWKNARWAEEVLPTLGLAGSFSVGPISFSGASVNAAISDFSYSNSTWQLPNLLVTRPEGRAHIAHISNERTGEFRFSLDSRIDLRFIRPVLDRSVQRIVDDFVFNLPPEVRGEIGGNWSKPKAISARLNLAVTNMSFRTEPIVACRTGITLSNLVLSCINPVVERKEGTGRAEAVVVDIPKMLLYITNASGRLDPAAITKVIHPSVEETMRPYKFVNAPDARAWGKVDLVNELGSDLWFELAGGPFEWQKWRFQQITGVVHWGGPFLTISNLIGSMHGGLLEGSLYMDFNVKTGAVFAFRTLVHDINLNSLIADMGNPTNKLEGTVGGLLVVTNANTESYNTWFGYGNMTLREGLIWEVPVFGLFSPVLNAIRPGAGNNRAREASATFGLTNGVFHSSDLRIHASGMRLNYDGTVDFDTRINGRVEAELFRDTPGIGSVVSRVLWPVTKVFEYKVTGTFGRPRADPVFIPRILMMPFHPLRTLRELTQPDAEEPLPNGNPPPATAP